MYHKFDTTLILSLLFFLILRNPPRSSLFPYTTLFRSLKFKTFEKLYRDSSQTIVARNFVISPSGILKCVLYKYSEIPDRKSTRLNSSHVAISYAVFCLKKKKINSLSLQLLYIIYYVDL